VDKAGIFGGPKRCNFSQVKRACEELGIGIIFVNSAQGKGRIEHSFGFLQWVLHDICQLIVWQPGVYCVGSCHPILTNGRPTPKLNFTTNPNLSNGSSKQRLCKYSLSISKTAET